ncbi:MAG: phosphoribosylformylglycinamidine cyclo-ligase [Armatimonadetes bacterium]|nr:MAG: phosphoribosylformylglycinamidine cyclo-ligase [Armatimonadota bacterium]
MDEQLTYSRAGVDIDEQNRAVRAFLPAVRETHEGKVLGGPGTFGGLFDGNVIGLPQSVLVSSMDGVGTKTVLAAMVGSFAGLGKDIVGHCINDILCHGARPLFFLDYFAASKLKAEAVAEVVVGAAEVCKAHGCVLIGGEIAEMPSVYAEGQVDVVGAIVGIVEKERLLPKQDVGPGDLLIGLASDGLHTNGYSLARKALLEVGGLSLDQTMEETGRTLAEELLRPHRCYLQSLAPLLDSGTVKAISHITGGGFYENLPRVFGTNLRAVVEKKQWVPPPIFQLIQRLGEVEEREMYRTFNMGIGMVLIAGSEHTPALVDRLREAGETPYVIGEITQGGHDVTIV